MEENKENFITKKFYYKIKLDTFTTKQTKITETISSTSRADIS